MQLLSVMKQKCCQHSLLSVTSRERHPLQPDNLMFSRLLNEPEGLLMDALASLADYDLHPDILARISIVIDIKAADNRFMIIKPAVVFSCHNRYGLESFSHNGKGRVGKIQRIILRQHAVVNGQ
ncbi:hypothetical protein D3C80_1859860 [compost metagenome]